MRTVLSALLLAAAATSLATAQETYWIANRASSDIMEVSPWGSVLRRVVMPTTLRSAHVAPDGKVWVVRFIQTTFDIVDPSTNPATITPVAIAVAPYDITFDAAGTAWITAGGTVVNYDPNGVLLQTYTLPAANGLGITIDTTGNKWIAHRVTPPSVSRIDPAGAVTNYPLTGAASAFLPTRAVADYRGLLTPSHVWIIGDSAPNLVEIDENGVTLNAYTLPTGSIYALAVDKNGDPWAGYSTGTLLKIDRTNGSVLATYALPPSINGLAIDFAANLWVTARITFSGVGPPCEVRRVDPATGIVEVPGALTFGGNNAAGTQSSLSTTYHYANVVAPFGDLDGDGDVNWSEIQNGTAPRDRWSTSACHVETSGVTRIANTMSFDVKTGPTTFWLLAFSFGLVAPGTGYTNPAFAGEMRLDPTLALPVTQSGVGNANLPFAIPNDPSFVGLHFFMQGFHSGPTTLAFTNIGGFLIW
ncbi:MAG: hypothetical protein FJ265_13615 [Planctomycetes bacterium]|nr:hypothetical protein [Planctomycetota bacterium]